MRLLIRLISTFSQPPHPSSPIYLVPPATSPISLFTTTCVRVRNDATDSRNYNISIYIVWYHNCTAYSREQGSTPEGMIGTAGEGERSAVTDADNERFRNCIELTAKEEREVKCKWNYMVIEVKRILFYLFCDCNSNRDKQQQFSATIWQIKQEFSN